MGIDAGFDMVPPLSRGLLDRHLWEDFLQRIQEYHHYDDRVKATPKYLVFEAGEHPRLPYEGHKFLRFSSKISGSHARGVEKYLKTVTVVARLFFGSRIRFWNEARDESGYYDWQEVHDSFKSYEEADESVIPTAIAPYVTGIIREPGVPLYDIEAVPGKGQGMVACCSIATGSRILCEKPFFTTPNLSPWSVMEESTATKLKALSKAEQRQFLSLHNNFPGTYPFSGIVRTNALPCGSGSAIGGVYPTICRINHSCLPNAHHSWNSAIGCETIHAVRDMRPGDEITIAYDRGGPAASRQTYLHDAFGFDCQCRLCALPTADRDASDARRIRIQALDSAIGDPHRVMHRPDASLADCYRLLHVLNEEYGDAGALHARLYYDAFQISITHGDQARASAFAERSYRSRMICEGDDSPETQKAKDLADNPSGHRNYGISNKWKTAKRMTPKDLESNEFEKWLWRRRD